MTPDVLLLAMLLAFLAFLAVVVRLVVATTLAVLTDNQAAQTGGAEARERGGIPLMATFDKGPYGRKPRSVLDGYRPIPYEEHVRTYGKKHAEEYLVEEHDDGTVTVLPNDATPYAWRRIWRKETARATPPRRGTPRAEGPQGKRPGNGQKDDG